MGKKWSQFRREIITYLDRHWQDKEIAKDLSEKYEYSERYFNEKFKKCFGCTFPQYLIKYKLHRAALAMVETQNLTNIWRMAGYANTQSFSKAFRKEFGLSPKHFMRSQVEIPDMPLCCQIGEKRIELTYAWLPKKTFYGYTVKPINENQSDIVKERGYIILHMEENLPFRFENDDIIGMWIHDDQCQLKYFMGMEEDKSKNVPKDAMKVVMPPDYYAIFTVPIEDADKAVLNRTIKELAEFVYNEWAIVNHKNLKKLGYSYEEYAKDRITLFIPVYERKYESEKAVIEYGTNAWFRYIDEHLTRDLTIEEIAAHFNYSKSHFIKTFEMYFNVAPGLYIKRRRLSVAANELKQANDFHMDIIKKYGFRSMEEFQNQFFAEFQYGSKGHREELYEPENLQQYYSLHKKGLLVSLLEIPDMCMIGKNTILEEAKKMRYGDLVEYISYLLQYQNSEEYDMQESGAITENKIVIWKYAFETGEPECLIGPELAENDSIMEEYTKVMIKGGLYAVVVSQNKNDDEYLADTYRMLYRCSFDGWIRENWDRVDFHRLSFVKYEKGKLYFYIPVNV